MRMKLSAKQSNLLRCFPYQRSRGELIPLFLGNLSMYKHSMHSVYAMQRKGLIELYKPGMCRLTEDGERMLREIDPEWAKLTEQSREMR